MRIHNQREEVETGCLKKKEYSINIDPKMEKNISRTAINAHSHVAGSE